MAQTELNIVLKLVDEATEGLKKSTESIKKQFSSASQSLDDFGKKAKSLGKELSQVGSTVAFVGAGITGPFILAINKAAGESIVLSNRLKTIDSIGQQLSNTVAQSLVPIIDKFINGISSLLNWFNSLDPAIRDMIIQATFLTGVFISISGIVTVLVGKFIGLAANLISLTGVFLGFAAANAPLLLIVGSLATIIILMGKFKVVADTVMSTFQVLFLFLKNGFISMKAGFELALVGMLEGLQKFSDLVSKLPSALGFAFKAIGLDIKNTSQSLRTMANQDLQAIIRNANEVGNILSTGTGSWSQNFDMVKGKVESLVQSIKKIGTSASTSVAQASVSFKQLLSGGEFALSSLSAALEGAAAENQKFAKAAAAVALALAIVHTASGVTRAFQDYPWPFSAVVAGIVAAAGAIQVATIAAQKFHSGGMIGGGNLASDEIPIIAQSGEGILSRKGVSALGGESNLNRLNSGQSIGGSTGDVQVNIYYPKFNNKDDMDRLMRDISFNIQKELRYAR